MSTVVRPLTAREGRLLRDEPAAFTRLTGLAVAEGYLAFPEALTRIVDALKAGMSPRWWSHLLIDPDRRTVVGLGGYKGLPHDGAVEIGYSVAPAHRGRGHATAAVAHWLRSATAGGVATVTAHTLAEPNPSTRVLERSRFHVSATLRHRELGQVWRWRRDLRPDLDSPAAPRPEKKHHLDETGDLS